MCSLGRRLSLWDLLWQPEGIERPAQERKLAIGHVEGYVQVKKHGFTIRRPVPFRA